jgi:hypothetical protein
VPLDLHRAYALEAHTPSRHRDEDAVFCVAPAATATHLTAEVRVRVRVCYRVRSNKPYP